MVLNHKNIISSIEHFKNLLDLRLKYYFQKNGAENELSSFPILNIEQDEHCPFTKVILDNDLTSAELLIVVLALIPHLIPGYLDEILKKYLKQNPHFPLFGGSKGQNHRGIMPTVETALFLLAGNNLPDRLMAIKLFLPDSKLVSQGIIEIEKVSDQEPWGSGKIRLSKNYLELLTLGKTLDLPFSLKFPAKRIHTKLDWEDVVLHPQTLQALEELMAWVKHHGTLDQLEINKHLKPGYRTLFYGPSGTGKTIAANLLGKSTGKEVYRVDLSMVVSKFIGETEKNLSSLFAQAEHKDWILFFDEADALFGKRTNVRDAHDRYANQEVAYLLQRIEDYDGLVILASNFKENIDDAFTRRFQAIIHFPIPNSKERLVLWQKILPKELPLAKDVNIEMVAQRYELTGASIVNIVEHCSLLAIVEKSEVITSDMLLKSIRREFLKEGKRV